MARSAPTSMSLKLMTVSGMPRSPMVGSRRPISSPGVSSRKARKAPIPSSLPSASKTRANTRCIRDTPPPVIQCLVPLTT